MRMRQNINSNNIVLKIREENCFLNEMLLLQRRYKLGIKPTNETDKIYGNECEHRTKKSIIL